MERIIGDRINLRFATKEEIRIVYDLMVADDIYDAMFDEEHPAPSWEAFREDEIEYFKGCANKNGNYLLIELGDDIAGCISYSNGYDKILYSELDIWLSGVHTGAGLGTEAILLLRNYVHNEYGINVFLIRPWKKNVRAIKAYNKCGFHEVEGFDIGDYYGDDELEAFGDGDYGIDGTVNLVMRYEA